MSRKARAKDPDAGWVDQAVTERGLLLPPLPATVADDEMRLPEALVGGGVIGLLIDPIADDVRLEALCRACRQHGVAAILVGAVDRAAAIGAEGVQLRAGPAIAAARAAHGTGLLIGAACDGSRHLAMEAGEQGADYVLFGAEGDDGESRIELVRWWSELFVLPCAATCSNMVEAASLLRAGADFLVPAAAFWQDPDGVEPALRPYRAALAALTAELPRSA